MELCRGAHNGCFLDVHNGIWNRNSRLNNDSKEISVAREKYSDEFCTKSYA